MKFSYPVLLDGAMGTELIKCGFKNDMAAEQWSLENPEAVKSIQRAYVEAGSDFIYTPTFGANRIKLEARKITAVKEYISDLVAISRDAAGSRARIIGDIAPTGKLLYPLGDIHFDQLYDVYHEAAEAMEEASVDMFVVETMMTVAEARAAVLAVRDVSDKPVFCTFTVEENGRTLTGTVPSAALVIMQALGVDAFGLNCSVGPDKMAAQIRQLSEYSSIPLIAKANAGVPKLIDGKTVYEQTPEEYVRHVHELADAGVCIFGGCCGTDAAHIRALKEALEGVKCTVPEKKDFSGFLLATEKEPFVVSRCDAENAPVIECGEDFEDDLLDLLDEEPSIIRISISDSSSLPFFEESQVMISVPVILSCQDADVLDRALRLYQGLPVITGCDAESLKALSEKYGAEIL